MRLSGSRVQGSGFRKNRAAGQRSYTTTSNPTTTTGRRPDATARIPTATTGPRPDATARIPMDTTERRPDATARIPTVGALPRSAIPRPKGIRTANSSGVALILTLGLLAVITLAVVAFVVTMRIEHLAARNTSSRTAARQYVEVGLAEAMGAVNGTLIYSAYPVQGWSVTNTPECLYAPATNAQGIYLFRGAVTNLLPGLLAQQAAQAYCDWNITITETNTATGNAGIQAGRVSFLIVNLSGMMDVHALDTNKLAALGEGLTAYNRMNPTGAYQRVFLTQPDLTAANNGAVSNLVTFSYDPGPEVFFAYTNLPSIGTYAFGGMLSNRFNINSATQYVGNYDSAAFQANWLTPVSNLLADAGLPASDQVAWNILNYLDPGRTPVVAAGSPPAYRTGYGVKDIPMINRVSLEPINANPEYGVSVELWYPFVPNPAPDKVWLWVGVYTNDSFLADAQTAIANLGDPPLSPMSFKVLVPTQMNYGGAAEFYVGATTNLPAPPLPISFKELVPFPLPPTTVYHVIGKDYPVWIWPRVYVEDAPGHLVCVDEALVCGNLPTRWEGAGCIQYGDPRTNQCGAAMVDATSGLTLVATNANCSIPSLPLVHADA
ncbi:MAG: pilus assembly PilX N-terminal domain-containing protein, partial [bacterium]